MIRSILFRALLGVILLQGSLLVTGCSSDASLGGESTETGTLTMPLLATAGEHTYRLQGGLYVSGAVFVFLDVNAEATELAATLPTGNYTANLYTWTLTRNDGAGNFIPVSATLVSSSSPSFTIFNQATTSVSFQFETDGQLVTVGAGHLTVDIDVNETPAICTVLGSDCPVGMWCAPTELTGAPLSCISEGPVVLGAACRSPLDCASNSSCFDFGSGAACAALCASADFNLACNSGGTCTPQGVDYGVCR